MYYYILYTNFGTNAMDVDIHSLLYDVRTVSSVTETRAMFHRAFKGNDVIITTGGVSMGEKVLCALTSGCCCR